MRANNLAFFVFLFWYINLPVSALRIWALQGGNIKSHPVVSCVFSMLTFKLWLKQVCRSVFVCFELSGTAGAACSTPSSASWEGRSSSATAAAAFGSPGEAPWTEEECKRYSPVQVSFRVPDCAHPLSQRCRSSRVYSAFLPSAVLTYIFQKYVNTNYKLLGVKVGRSIF